MVKKSKVKSVQANGTWQNKKGDTFYKYEIEMENGDAGEYSSISDKQEKFIEGVEIEYNFTQGEYPKIKAHYSNPNPTFFGFGIISSSASELIPEPNCISVL